MLRDAESEEIESYCKRINVKNYQTVVYDTENPPVFNPAQLILMDEADNILIDKAYVPQAKFVVALTATPIKETQSLERLLLVDMLGFAIMDPGFVQPDYDDIDTVQSLRHFFEVTKGMPKVLFLDPEDAKWDPKVIEERKLDTIQDSEELEHYENITSNTCFLQTEEDLMRGVDYRTKVPQGIALLLMRPLSSIRAYRQALGRVGRYGSKCYRAVINGFVQRENADLARRLEERCENFKTLLKR